MTIQNNTNEEELYSRYWEVAATKCNNCGAIFLSLHPEETSEPVECNKCDYIQAYFGDRFPVILHKIEETYHLRITTGSPDTDDIGTATIGSGFTLNQAFMNLMQKLEPS